ncbi:hypothetical protein F2P81_016105 [Scophthalmus maximus]|uniref:Uncharacterized protein n=1 Tax=Scophthalmus maximus TaxID=52904 RepID=A0A6A4SI31_SCOMX|nr:hypothetical protein F2P81_016105 [Scophthalmus maximus]
MDGELQRHYACGWMQIVVIVIRSHIEYLQHSLGSFRHHFEDNGAGERSLFTEAPTRFSDESRFHISAGNRRVPGRSQRAFEPSRSPQTVQSFDFQSLHQLETILTVKTVDYIFSSHLCKHKGLSVLPESNCHNIVNTFRRKTNCVDMLCAFFCKCPSQQSLSSESALPVNFTDTRANSVEATRCRTIGSPRSPSSNHRTALAPPTTSLAWRKTEQEFRVCAADRVVDGATPPPPTMMTTTNLWRLTSAARR